MSQTIKHYSVVGRAVKNSLSPIIHRLFAEQTNKHIVYDYHLIKDTHFAKQIDQLRAQGISGVNVTMPFKMEAFAYAQQHSKRAGIVKAANTLCFNHDSVYADNTDGIGLLNDIQDQLQWPVHNAHICIIGAGGAVNGILADLIAAKPKSIYLVNRTRERAVKLAQQFNHIKKITVINTDDLPQQLNHIDLLIYAISYDCALPDWITTTNKLDNTVCYDLNYQCIPTPFMTWAKQQHAQAISDGLGMLVEQAAVAFTLWHGVNVDTQSILTRLRNH